MAKKLHNGLHLLWILHLISCLRNLPNKGRYARIFVLKDLKRGKILLCIQVCHVLRQCDSMYPSDPTGSLVNWISNWTILNGKKQLSQGEIIQSEVSKKNREILTALSLRA